MRSLVFALVCGLAGCDALLGIEELPRANVTDDAAVGVDTAKPPNAACIACETNACADKRTACLGDATCGPLLQCLEFCGPGDVECRGTCERNFAAAVRAPAFSALDLCRRKSCVDDCFGASGFGTAIDDKCGCVDKACAAEMRACIQSGMPADDAGPTEPVGSCDRRMACLGLRPDPDNYVTCVMDNLGSAEANALLRCMRSNACPLDDSGPMCPLTDGTFQCLNNFDYASNKSVTSVDFVFGVENVFTKKGIEGASVTACTSLKCGPDCIKMGGQLTGPDGKAKFALSIPEGTFDGCLYVPPYKDSAGNEYMGLSVFPGRRINRNESTITSYALQEGVLELYASQVSQPLLKDEGHGHVLVAIHDCIWGRVAGATVRMLGTDPATRLAYIEGIDAKPALKATSRDGAAALINVPVGNYELIVDRNGEVYARVNISVRARELTDVNVYPLSKNP